MKKCNQRKSKLLIAGVMVVMSSVMLSCHKLGLYQQLPGDPYIVVSDAQNNKNKASTAIVKDANDKVFTAYYVEIVSTGTKSTLTPDLVIDTLLVSIPPDLDPYAIKVVPQFLNTSMTAVKIVDTNKIRSFQLQDAYSLTFNGRTHSYTLIDTAGLWVTFSNGYQRKYVILAEVLDYVPPRIYDLGSYTGGLDSVGYDDANQTITIYRSPLNNSLQQIFDYKIEPANAVIDPSYQPGAEFDFASAVIQTIPIPVIVPTKSGGTHTENYKLKLHLGYKSIKQIMDGTKTSEDNNYYTGTYTTDRVWKVAVDEHYVYVLVMNRTSGTVGTVAMVDFQNADYDLYAYPIQATATAPIKMSTGGNKIIDIICFNNVLYGIGIIPVNATTNKYQIFKWEEVAVDKNPVPVSKESVNTTHLLLAFTGKVNANNIVFYSASTSTRDNNPTAVKITADINGNESSSISLDAVSGNWTNTPSILSGSLIAYGSYIDVPEAHRGIFLVQNGFLFGTDYANTPGVELKAIARYSTTSPIGNADLVQIGNKYYMFHIAVNGSNDVISNTGMYVFDMGLDIGATIDAISGNTATQFYKNSDIEKYFSAFNYKAVNLAGNVKQGQFRGNTRAYRMSNGKIRVASLVPLNGFKVWELQ